MFLCVKCPIYTALIYGPLKPGDQDIPNKLNITICKTGKTAVNLHYTAKMLTINHKCTPAESHE